MDLGSDDDWLFDPVDVSTDTTVTPINAPVNTVTRQVSDVPDGFGHYPIVMTLVHSKDGEM